MRLRSFVLLGVVILQFALALFPFRFNPSREVDNDVHYTADGVLSTGADNRAQTTGPPDWFPEAITDGRLTVDLLVRARLPDQDGPARILTLSEGQWEGNFTVGQDDGDLVLRVRRPGSDSTGDPPYVVPHVLGDLRWHAVLVRLGEVVEVTVDGRRRLVEPLPEGTWETWESGYRVAVGDEPYGERPWRGELRRAEIRTATHTVDYVRPGELDVPEVYGYAVYRPWEPLRRPSLNDALIGLLHLALFVPVGVALRRLRRPPLGHVAVVVVAASLAVAIQAAKMLVAARHPAVADVLWFSAGALLGSCLCAAVARNADTSGSRRSTRE